MEQRCLWVNAGRESVGIPSATAARVAVLTVAAALRVVVRNGAVVVVTLELAFPGTGTEQLRLGKASAL